ncbi:MAG: PEP-CTERM sorting domain-containing protein [Proteobacteria bacterium]|nr:PEP-CTERM sorting domain-containing protein [Pseudomonadota bacterium]
MKIAKISALTAAAMASAFFTPAASAGPIAIYQGPAINWSSSIACGNFGDAVSCSLPWLNVLAGYSETRQTDASPNPGYVQPSSQGLLKDSIVIQAGGAAALDNSDTTPTPASVENGFKSNSGSDQYLATGKANGTTMAAGNMTDPTNNNLTAAQDNLGTWDVSTTWLRDALTTADGKRHELMVMFDYNQPQSATTSMNIWSLITVRDSSGNLADINYEFKETGNTPYNSFTSNKTFFSQPSASDFETVSGTICIYQNTTFPNAGGSCPTATGATGPLLQTIDNAQGTNATEFAAFFPELNANLESYIAQGYDTISVRMLMGCFGNPNDSTTGQGYLSSGQTTQCDSGGFGDVYIMGGAEMTTQVPEPTTLALAALGLLGGLYCRQRQS